jgi:polyphosphate glucokinase
MTESSRSLPSPRTVLVVDIGGSHIKVLATGHQAKREAESGPHLTPDEAVKTITRLAEGWQYDAISIGYPGPVRANRASADPANLGAGWVDFDFEAALCRPVRMVNDALLQALGSYEGGRMLFLGLGTGLGSALVLDGLGHPLELAHLPYRKHRSYEEYLGERGLDRLGTHKWRRRVADVVGKLQAALCVDDVVIGGGNVAHLDVMPAGARRGDNAYAFVGGFRLWQHGHVRV